MSKREATEFLITKVDEALRVYGTDIVSVDYNEETQMVDINQCHGAWSDVIFKNVIPVTKLDMRVLLPALGRRSVGYCI